MNPVIWVLAIVGPLWLAAAATFIVFVIGIHRGDRGHLRNSPRCRSDAFARRFLATSARNDSKEDGK